MADPTPTIVGEPHLMTVNHGSGEKSIEDMVNSGPPIPAPVHGNLLQYPTRQPTHPILDNPSNTTNVYVRGLPPDTDDDKLLEMTARFGRVTSHKAIMDTEHGTCKG